MSHKYSFYNDYSEGAHPKILDALGKTNLTQETGYGEDSFSLEAAKLLSDKIQNPNSSIHLVSGGTQANLIVLSSILKPYEAVIAPKTAHINVHEAGAIEATGHKVISVDSTDGKIKPEQVLEQVKFHSDEHYVKPRAVFISNATELGTVYTKKELQQLSKICKENNLYLYLDGARLGSALMSKGSDLTLPEVSKLVDIFYIGGTKNGSLIGEAIIINNPKLQENFRYYLKQKGALLAKGRVIGVQFLELFKDNLFLDLAKHANKMATRLTDGIKALGYEFLTDSPTNQIFPILPNTVIEKLQNQYGFYVWSEIGKDKSSIRLVTSWATEEKAIEEFIADLKSI